MEKLNIKREASQSEQFLNDESDLKEKLHIKEKLGLTEEFDIKEELYSEEELDIKEDLNTEDYLVIKDELFTEEELYIKKVIYSEKDLNLKKEMDFVQESDIRKELDINKKLDIKEELESKGELSIKKKLDHEKKSHLNENFSIPVKYDKDSVIPQLTCRKSKNKREKKLKTPAKTPAERSRAYRARKRALKITATQGFTWAEDNTTDESLMLPRKLKIKKSPTDCSRAYRARKKANIAAIQETIMCTLNIAQSDGHENNLPLANATTNNKSTKVSVSSAWILPKKAKTRKTPADYSREYRARKKALKIAANQGSIKSMLTISQPNRHQGEIITTNMDFAEISQSSASKLPKKSKTRKTPAECSRAYRARKKALRNVINQELVNSTSFITKTDGEQDIPPSKKLTKDSIRKKLKSSKTKTDYSTSTIQSERHENNSTLWTLNADTNITKVSINSVWIVPKKTKNPADYHLEYLAWKQALKNVVELDSIKNDAFNNQSEMSQDDSLDPPLKLKDLKTS